jgi:hypothetical protein
MPRPERRIVEGGLSHVTNRLGRSQRALDRKREADAVVDLLRCAVQRDGLTVFDWCLSSTYHHLPPLEGARSEYATVWKRRHKHKGVHGTFFGTFLILLHSSRPRGGCAVGPCAADTR